MKNNKHRDFEIHEVFKRLRSAIKPFPRAALFELRDEGFNSLFEQLVACVLSIRTFDEVSIEAARRLFAVARTPAQILELTVQQIDEVIAPCTYHTTKAKQIHEMASRVQTEFDGDLPGSYEVLTSFKGIGPKCANLALGIACNQPRVGVDIHVHRVCNRWGIIATKTPEVSTQELEKILPREYWIETNELLVPFGKHICTGKAPQCSTCSIREICAQIGVVHYR